MKDLKNLKLVQLAESELNERQISSLRIKKMKLCIAVKI